MASGQIIHFIALKWTADVPPRLRILEELDMMYS